MQSLFGRNGRCLTGYCLRGSSEQIQERQWQSQESRCVSLVRLARWLLADWAQAGEQA